MATATEPTQETQATERSPLWGVDRDGNEVQIPVIGGTGAYHSGKTLFGMTIAPGNKRTRWYDIELSGLQYWRGLGIDYVDVQATMRQFNDQADYSQVELFRWWLADIRKIQPGQYDVIGIDPITDIESGMVDWVKSRYREFGFKSADKFESTGGIFWSKVKEEWKIILADIAARCQTFYFTAHTKQVWKNGSPSKDVTPKGKSTLMELASLYLFLEREKDKKGNVPKKPRCKEKLKDRVSYTTFDPSTFEPSVVPYLPPAFDDCTPNKIRDYVKAPADYDHLSAAERIKADAAMSEEDKLLLQREIAEQERQAEEVKLERLSRQQEIAEAARVAEEKRLNAKPVNVDESGSVKAVATEQKTAELQKPVENPEPEPAVQEPAESEVPFDTEPQAEKSTEQATPDQVELANYNRDTFGNPGMSTWLQMGQLIHLKYQMRDAMGWGDDKMNAWFAAGLKKNTKDGSDQPEMLTEEKADLIITNVSHKLEELRKMKYQRSQEES